MDSYITIAIYYGIVSGLTLTVLAVSALLPSRKMDRTKFLPYESGIITQTALLKKRIPLHHFLVALVFLIFDVEVVFLYPWAVISKSIGWFGFCELLFFVVVLFTGYAYAWKKGGLQWE